jgi:hypothetical protein
VQTSSFAESYSSKTDDELIALAADPDALLEEARPILAEELRRRNITVTETTSLEQKPDDRGRTEHNLLRVAGRFLLNLTIAILGTTAVESALWSIVSQVFPVHSESARAFREWLLSLTIAALLGFFIGRRRSATAIWVWTLPVVFFGLGVLVYSARPTESVLVGGHFAEHFFSPNCLAKRFECRDFYLFTVPAIRAVAYSFGAWFWLELKSRRSEGLRQPKLPLGIPWRSARPAFS